MARFTAFILSLVVSSLVSLDWVAAEAMTHVEGDCLADPAYVEATAAIEAAQRANDTSQYRAANLRLDGALRNFERIEVRRPLNDDSGLHLSLAAYDEADGNFDQAAEIRAGILSERMERYRQVHGCP